MFSGKIHASAAFGLESSVRRELEALGFKDIKTDRGHLVFNGDMKDVALANLALRVADRVELELASFEAGEYEDIYRGVRNIDWPYIIGEMGAFPVNAGTVSSKLKSVRDLQSVAKKAIVDRLRDRFKLTYFQEAGPTYPIRLRLNNDHCQVLLDTTGEGLFKRGYREEKGGAPIKETLASGLVDLSFWNKDRPLLDPFCGSGTILIEAARKARNIDPGLDRNFTFMAWPQVDLKEFKKIRRQRMERIDFKDKLEIMGFDIDPGIIKTAVANAHEAGVADDIIFVPKDMRECNLKENFGVIITNPPYGKRLGEVDEAEGLLKDFAEHFSRLRTWSTYVISPTKNLEKYMMKKADKRRKLFNGGLETTYYQFYGPNPAAFL